MVADAMRENSEFGIVLAKEDGIVNAGCTVVVDKVLKQYPDGRLDIMTSGRRRFEIVVLNEDKDYLQGEVEFFDDEDSAPAPDEVLHRALDQYKGLLEIGDVQPHSLANLKDPQLSFQLAQAVHDVDFLSLLLRNRSEAGRLKELNEFFSEYIPRQRHIARVKHLAPMNGFGGKPAGL